MRHKLSLQSTSLSNEADIGKAMEIEEDESHSKVSMSYYSDENRTLRGNANSRVFEEGDDDDLDYDDDKEEDLDDYILDGFVVGDSSDDEVSSTNVSGNNACSENNKQHQINRRKRKQNSSRVLRKGSQSTKILPLSGYDGAAQHLPDRMHEDLGTAEQNTLSFINELNTHKSSLLDLFMDDSSDIHQVEDSDEILNKEEKRGITDVFSPADVQNYYECEEDKLIRDTDIPERLQLNRHEKIRRKYIEPTIVIDDSYILQETQWIVAKQINRNDHRFSDIEVQKKLLVFLESLHMNMEEVMYMYTYRKNYFHPDFNLKDLWLFYDLDGEYCAFRRIFSKVSQLLAQVHVLVEANPATEMVVNREDLNSVEQMLQTASDYRCVKTIKEYLEYALVKIEAVLGLKNTKCNDKRNRLTQVYVQCNIHSQLKMIMTPQSHLMQNLQEGAGLHLQVPQTQRPQEVAEYLLKINQGSPYIKSTLDSLECLSDMYAREMFHFPPLNKWMMNNYREMVYISTEPTEEGKAIDVFNKLYAVKRIHNRRFKDFDQDIWLLVEEAEKRNLIVVSFEMRLKGRAPNGGQTRREKPIDSDLCNLVILYSLTPLHKVDPSVRDINLEWNLFRKFSIEVLFSRYFVPQMQKYMYEELHQASESWVIEQCAKKFQTLLSVEPLQIDHQSPRIMAVVKEEQRIWVVFVDENGQLKDSMVLCNYLRNAEELTIQSRNDKVIEEQELNAKMNKNAPHVAVISANCLEAQMLKKRVEQHMTCVLADDTIPRIVVKKQQIDTQIHSNKLERMTSVALSLARMHLNPMAEILYLWNERIENNGCLHIPLHPSKEFVSGSRLKAELEKCAIEVVNSVGIDLDTLRQEPHTTHLLQHVCGLGTRKAMKINDMLYKNNIVVKKRKHLKKRLLIQAHVFKNMNGFIRFRNVKNQYENTRISTEYYQIAKQICLKSIDNISLYLSLPTEAARIEYSKSNSNVLQSMDLSAYAKQLHEEQDLKNMLPMLTFIRDEIINGFSFKYAPFTHLSQQALFFLMIKETPSTFCRGMTVSVKVLSITPIEDVISTSSARVAVRLLDSHLKSSVVVTQSYAQSLRIGEVIKVYIESLSVLSRKQMDDPKYSESDFKYVSLTLKQRSFNDLARASHHCFREQRIRSTFTFVEAEDKPESIKIVASEKPQFNVSRISHPCFKNITKSECIAQLQNASLGDLIIRPCSQENQDLAISWKFFDEIVIHMSLREEMGPHNAAEFNSKVYIIENSKEIFNTLDEIIEKRIAPCFKLINEIKDHRKFSRISLDAIETDLKQSQASNPNTIHYTFMCAKQYPQCVVLLHCSQKDIVAKEWIGVRHQGLFFHSQLFATFKDLVVWFKNNFHKPNYTSTVTSLETVLDVSNVPESVVNSLNNGHVNEKQSISHSDSSVLKCGKCSKAGHDSSTCWSKKQVASSKGRQRTCYICKKQGHMAKECTMASELGSSAIDKNGRVRRRSRSRSYDKKS